MGEIKKELEEIKKMLRAVINGQSALRETMMSEDRKTRDELKKEINDLRNELVEVEKRLTWRIDAQGKQLNELDDDAPTGEEFRKLSMRVKKLERKLVSAN